MQRLRRGDLEQVLVYPHSRKCSGQLGPVSREEHGMNSGQNRVMELHADLEKEFDLYSKHNWKTSERFNQGKDMTLFAY